MPVTQPESSQIVVCSNNSISLTLKPGGKVL